MSLATFVPLGRLGNNMFQTAACIAYAKQHGMQWAIPASRKAWDTFDGQPTPWLLPQFWPNLPVTNGGGGHRYEQHDVKMFNYQPIPYFAGGVTLVGFFQSEKWFENAKEEVKAAFPLQHYPEYEKYVSIHVRRGDYVTNSNSFPPIDEDYIYKSYGTILNRLKSTSHPLLFFSDDINWCKERFTESGVEFNEDSNEYTALSKMTSCSHHIIANSTFSWWGAWLGYNPDKIVVAPHPEDWFGRGFTGSTPVDLLPSQWVKIKFR